MAKVRLTIREIATLLMSRLAFTHQSASAYHQLIRNHHLADNEPMFSPFYSRVIKQMFEKIATIVATRFVQNDQSVPLLELDDLSDFHPDQIPVDLSQSKKERFADELKFTMMLGVVYGSFQVKDAYGEVRKWVQTVIHVAKDHGTDPLDFVKQPGANDAILRRYYTKSEYLDLKLCALRETQTMAKNHAASEQFVQLLAQKTGGSVAEIRATLLAYAGSNHQQALISILQTQAEAEASRIFDMTETHPN